jgi:spore coat polysaccharide biosynthesis protein SpsF
MLARQIERVVRAKTVDLLVLAVANRPADEPILDLADSMGVPYWQGDPNDVFERMYQCAKFHKADHVVRLTHDCPLIDPGIIDDVVNLHLDDNADYTSNVEPCTFPDGLDVEVYKVSAIEECRTLLRQTHEHVTTLLRHWPRWKLASVMHTPNLSHIRWTVDYPKDLEKVAAIYAALYDGKPDFTWLDVLNWEAKHGRRFA